MLKAVMVGATVFMVIGMSLLGRMDSASANKKVFPTNGKVTEYLNQMPECIDNMDTSVQFSSNPYDYIKNNVCYDKIVSLGVAALPELNDYLDNAKQNGLIEYIVAIAIEKITGADINQIENNPSHCGWQTAYEFRDDWKNIKNDLSENIDNILNSKKLSNEDKISRISNYGKIVIPKIESYLNNNINNKINSFEIDHESNNLSQLNNKLQELVDSENLTNDEKDIICQYLE